MKKCIFMMMGIMAFLFANAQSDTATLKAYEGKYNFPEGTVVPSVTITVENGSLTISSQAGTSVLEKTAAKDSFTAVAFQGAVVFKRDANKNITAIAIDAMGYHLEGKKQVKEEPFVELIGKYTFPSGSIVTEVVVKMDNGALIVETAQGNSALEKAAGVDSYNVIAFQGIAVFKRDTNKKIVGVVIDAMGYHLEGKKQ